MKIGITGLGYVGVTTLACLAKLGHKLIGVDINTEKINALKLGESVIIEPIINSLLSDHSSNIIYSTSTANLDVDCIFVCVGTPTDASGFSNLKALERCIGNLWKNKVKCPIIIRSTVPIGTCIDLLTRYPLLDIVFHPEFLREGTAVEDFFNPSIIVYGTQDGSKVPELETIYKQFKAPSFTVDISEAESLKYACNIFHALKIVFANEITKSLSSKNVDPNVVMKLFVEDKQLNISKAYLKPGFAYGGSCLEKDLQSYLNQMPNVSLPLLTSVSESNELIIHELFIKLSNESEHFVFNGLTFKEGIDDLRRSPFVALVKKLLIEGKTVDAYDDNLEELFGENKDILSDLIAFKNFRLNPYELFLTDPSVIFCHQKKHSKLPARYTVDYKLFPSTDVMEIYQ
jgi:GDP-mannose 6-dehydrogenase